MLGLLYFALLCTGQAAAHRSPKTDHEIEVQRALQAAAYHVCRFVVAIAYRTLMSGIIVCPVRRIVYGVSQESMGAASSSRRARPSWTSTTVLCGYLWRS